MEYSAECAAIHADSFFLIPDGTSAVGHVSIAFHFIRIGEGSQFSLLALRFFLPFFAKSFVFTKIHPQFRSLWSYFTGDKHKSLDRSSLNPSYSIRE